MWDGTENLNIDPLASAQHSRHLAIADHRLFKVRYSGLQRPVKEYPPVSFPQHKLSYTISRPEDLLVNPPDSWELSAQQMKTCQILFIRR
jgi:hypothetical protein